MEEVLARDVPARKKLYRGVVLRFEAGGARGLGSHGSWTDGTLRKALQLVYVRGYRYHSVRATAYPCGMARRAEKADRPSNAHVARHGTADSDRGRRECAVRSAPAWKRVGGGLAEAQVRPDAPGSACLEGVGFRPLRAKAPRPRARRQLGGEVEMVDNRHDGGLRGDVGKNARMRRQPPQGHARTSSRSTGHVGIEFKRPVGALGHADIGFTRPVGAPFSPRSHGTSRRRPGRRSGKRG